MFVADLASLLNAEAIVTFASGKLFVDYLPETPNEVVVLSDYMADQPEWVMKATTPPSPEHPRIQVMVRDDPEEVLQCEALCRTIYNRLCGIVGSTVGSYVATMMPLQTPTMAGRDEQKRVTYVCNFQTTVA